MKLSKKNFLDDAKNYKYWLAMRQYTCYGSTTNNKFTFFLVLLSNPLSHMQLFCLVFLCSALTQTVTTHAHGHQQRYKGHLQLKCSTTEQYIKTMLLCPMYSSQAEELIHRDMQRTMQKIAIPHLHFTVTATSVCHVSFTLRLCEN